MCIQPVELSVLLTDGSLSCSGATKAYQYLFQVRLAQGVEMTANIILWFWNACCKLLALNNHQMVLDMLMLLSYLHKLKPLLGCFAQTWCCIMLPSLSKISKLWASMDRLWLCLCLSPSENLGSFAGSAMSTCEAEMVLAAEAPGMAQRLDELLKWPF